MGMTDWAGRVAVTEQEVVLLQLLATGYNVAGIAGVLCYSPGYVYELLAGLRETLGVETNEAAVATGLQAGLFEFPGAGSGRD